MFGHYFVLPVGINLTSYAGEIIIIGIGLLFFAIMFTKIEKRTYMNKQELDILNALLLTPYENQRVLAEQTSYSLGAVNHSVRILTEQGYLDESGWPTELAKEFSFQHAPKRAIILAAGFASRMVPINLETPKALLEVEGEPLIERQIKQLYEVGITEIYVVVGYLKEQFDYLVDEYGVKLVVSSSYATKNNLHSMHRVLKYLDNAYIVPCDLWCRENPFSSRELYSWYMVSQQQDNDSAVRMNRKQELVLTKPGKIGHTMLGISYLTGATAETVKANIERLCTDHRNDGAFWETALFEGDRMFVYAKVVSPNSVIEINTYEQLRDLDGSSDHLQNDAVMVIEKTFSVSSNEITNIQVLKKGMTNRSFHFTCKGRDYIMRIPGEGTDQLIDRRQEARVYETIRNLHLCDDLVYIDPNTGYKITAMLPDARVCDPDNEADLTACIAKLHAFHDLKLNVPHVFNLFGQIEHYEALWNGKPSAYRDYSKTKDRVLSLQTYIESHAEPFCLTHIDAVPDNFLFSGNDLRLIDWEYAGMQDPHVDIAMFCIYALYDRPLVDHLIDLYFDNTCSHVTRVKIYCYIAVCGLLWSNWCEYKATLGVEFGEYSLRQYRYAKDYSKLALAEMEEIGIAHC